MESTETAVHRPDQKQIRLSEDNVRALVAEYQAGATIPSLVDHYGIHRTTVSAHLEEAGVDRRINRRRLTDDDVARAAQQYKAGGSLATVGKEFGVHPKTLWNEFTKAGVKLRPQQGGRPARPQSPSEVAG